MVIILTSLIIIGIVFPVLGCVLNWNKYVYFADGLSHASLLAAALSLSLSIPLIYAGTLTTIIFSLVFLKLKGMSDNTALISLISSSMLAVALIIIYISPTNIRLDNILLGDILAVDSTDLVLLGAILLSVVAVISYLFNKILIIALNRDIANTQHINVKAIELTFLILLSISILTAIKIVGSLLINSLIVIPAMSARIMSSTPTMMMLLSIIIGLSCNILSVIISFNLDLPLTPLIIIANVIIYFCLLLKKKIASN